MSDGIVWFEKVKLMYANDGHSIGYALDRDRFGDY